MFFFVTPQLELFYCCCCCFSVHLTSFISFRLHFPNILHTTQWILQWMFSTCFFILQIHWKEISKEGNLTNTQKATFNEKGNWVEFVCSVDVCAFILYILSSRLYNVQFYFYEWIILFHTYFPFSFSFSNCTMKEIHRTT